MDASKIRVADPWRDIRVGRVPSAAPRATSKRDTGRRLGCGDVARNRAARYARQRRIHKRLWPLIASFILMGLIFERRPLPAFSWARRRSLRDDEGTPPIPGQDKVQGVDGFLDPAATGDTAHNNPEPRYRPPARFLAKDISQVVAFLIRNRGKLDTPVVRAKWDHVDRLSLPLAIYLREIEAMDAWADLEKEISAAPPGVPIMSRAEMPKSMRHRKILRLLPEWSRRGDELLSPQPAEDSTPTPSPDIDGDDDPDIEPRKP